MVLSSASTVVLDRAELWAAPQNQGQPASQPTTVGAASAEDPLAKRLARAIDLYRDSEFDRALTMLRALAKEMGQQRSRHAQEVYTYLACTYVALGRQNLAIIEFERALNIRPDLKPPFSAPKILQAFEQAKNRYQAKVRALDHDAPKLEHQALKNAKFGSGIPIKVHATDLSGIAELRCRYRISGNRGFSSIKLEETQKGNFIATIPTIAVVRPGIEYYIEAWDTVGNGPAVKGSSRAPIKVSVTGGPLPGATAKTDSIARKWWFWVAIAGTAVVAASVAGGIYATRSKSVALQLDIPTSDLVGTGEAN